MNLQGYCIKCHKIRRVNVKPSDLERMVAYGTQIPNGVCPACQEDQDQRRGQTRITT